MSRRAEARIDVLVVDDDRRFRRVVSAVVAAEADMVVVGEAGDGDQAVAMARALVPSVVLLDVRMPGTGGIEAARAIAEGLPTTKIIMLTASDEEDDLFKALRAGASGYVLKGDDLHDVGVSIRAVASGQTLLSPAMAAKLVAEFSHPAMGVPEPEPIPVLSDRELDVLRLVARGQANGTIAQQLYVSAHTVKRHLANILAKWHLRTRLDAVLYAQRRDLLG